MAHQTLTPEVRAVLERSTIEGNHLKLPPLLERKLYESVNKALKNAGGQWKGGKTQAHVFDCDPREKLGLMLATGVAMDMRKELQAFDTPQKVAKRLVAMAGIESGHSVLEPSAGLGMLALEARDAGGTVDCVEIDRERCEALTRLRGLGVIKHADFLKIPHKDWRYYDRIVMNPPFAKRQGIKHVEHALEFLKPGGKLVAIMQPNHANEIGFKLLGWKVFIDEVEAGAFKESGTNIPTVIVTISETDSAKLRQREDG